MYISRMKEIITYCANRAGKLEKLPSGFWHHHDIRNNFYDASYLFAAALDHSIALEVDREHAKREAEQVMLQVLRLQDRHNESDTYGHWPLRLEPSPAEAKVNPLPAELMGLLMVYFYKRYKQELSAELRAEFEAAFETLRNSSFYRVPLHYYHHHEAKYTAAKIIYGTIFNDSGLLKDGAESLEATLERIKKVGMTEYGCLPWFWHWVQAFTSAYEIAEDEQLRSKLKEMLDFLWDTRAVFYWKGAWVGAHSRGLPHDLPSDGNVLFDYVQFGDFSFPADVPRVEYAGFLYAEAPVYAIAKVNERTYPHEVKQLVPAKPEASNYEVLHSYVYMDKSFTAGGMWERAVEFDNEQHRWSITLPASGDGLANRVYFFHPGVHFGGVESNDWRHQSNIEQIVMHKGAVLALYPIADNEADHIIGCLPKGTWLFEEKAMYGQCGDVYIAVHLQQSYTAEERSVAWRIVSQGSSNGAAVEAISLEEAAKQGIANLEQFADAQRQKPAVFAGGHGAEYRTLANDRLELRLNEEMNQFHSIVNEQEVSFEAYRVNV
ncbi:hypothetical protein [Paenibacillus sp. IITD108]|uniref:hypothetical protein n=1 Tax=Paenibacillus sp. IITD108 TaxID=3116649 RepID=UPI002F41F7B8